MADSSSLKRSEGNGAAGGVERPVKRARISTEPSSKDTNLEDGAEDDAEGIDEDSYAAEDSGPSDLYLDTVRSLLTRQCLVILTFPFNKINRATLDFDFEKVCSVSLSNINIYGCLVCGKYFQGRGRNSYAYAHSIHDDH